jgi:hypothetical protein
MSQESELLNIMSRQGDDHVGPHPRPDLAERNLLPDNKGIGLQIARNVASAASDGRKDTRPLVFGSLPGLQIDGVNLVSPNAPGVVAQTNLAGITLENNRNFTITIPPNENPTETVLWEPSGDALWIHFKTPVTMDNVIEFMLEMKNFILSLTNNSDINYTRALIWTQFLTCDWDPKVLCWNNQPNNFDTAQTQNFPLSTFRLNDRYFDLNTEDGVQYAAGNIPAGQTIDTDGDNVANPGINDFLGLATDTSNESRAAGPVLVDPVPTTTTFKIAGWPFNYVNSGASTAVEQVIFDSQYNVDQPTAFKGVATLTPWDHNNPGGKAIETSNVMSFAADGTWTVNPPFSFAPRAPTHVVQVSIPPGTDEDDSDNNPNEGQPGDTDTMDATAPDLNHTDDISIILLFHGMAIRMFALQPPAFYTNGRDFLNWKAKATMDSVALSGVPPIQSIMTIPGAKL